MPDLISLTGLRVRGFHGVFEHEKRDGQDFVVDAQLETSHEAAAASDELADTVDYGVLAQRLAEIVAGPAFDLIETLVVRLAQACLDDPRVTAATVTVHKPQAPIPLQFADVAVTVRRERRSVAAGPRVVLSIGSNLGDRLATLRQAVDTFRPWLVAASSVYETPPWGPVEQGPYLNAVLIVRDPTATPADWLTRAHAAEAAADRTREVRWGPRTLDVDIVDVESVSSEDPELTLPHPRAAERAFVLVPWLELEPQARLNGLPVADLLAALDAGEADGVHRIPDRLVEP